MPELVLFLLNFRKGTIRSELSQFAKALHGEEALPSVSNAAFCQARGKLRYSALKTLNDQVVKQVGEQLTLHRWHDFRLLAVDGSTGQLPAGDEIQACFGGPDDAHRPMARFSTLFDVLNKIIAYADMAPYSHGERLLAANYLYEGDERDLFLYDRGYAAYWLFAMHRDLERTFCARVKLNYNHQVKAFVASDQSSQVIDLQPCAQAKTQCEEYNICPDPVPVRLVRVELKSGQVEVLITSLIDEATYPTAWFKALYHARWGAEEHYKRQKARVEIENFSGRKVDTLYQDFYAKIIALNLAALWVWIAQSIAQRLYSHRQHTYQINFAHALSLLKNDLVRYLHQGLPREGALRLFTEILNAVEAVKPNRSFPRRKRKTSGPVFHSSFKRTA